MNQAIRTLIIDDHAVVRDGITRALEIRSGFEIFSAASKAEAIAQISRINPTLIFVDINLSDGNGLEIVAWLRKISKVAAVVVLSLHDEDEYVLAAMKAGASAYVNKSESLSVLMNFMEHALKNPTAFSAESLGRIMSQSDKTFGLSQREMQILSQLGRGESLKELAVHFFIAESTLKKHLSAIYRKLQVTNRVQAIAKARQAGLLK